MCRYHVRELAILLPVTHHSYADEVEPHGKAAVQCRNKVGYELLGGLRAKDKHGSALDSAAIVLSGGVSGCCELCSIKLSIAGANFGVVDTHSYVNSASHPLIRRRRLITAQPRSPFVLRCTNSTSREINMTATRTPPLPPLEPTSPQAVQGRCTPAEN